MVVDRPSPNFRKMLTGASHGEVLVPVIRSALFDPNFKAFEVRVRGFTKRPPDGWFHPSSHPMLGERALYHYIVDPEQIIPEIRDPHSVMAVTQGSFWHDFIQSVLLDIGALQVNPNPSPGMHPAEWFWSHLATKARGHSDGLTPEEDIFEFKSMNNARLSKFPAGAPDDPSVIAHLRKVAPDYFAQGQEYMRLSGRRRWRAVLMAIEYPYPMREIVMDYDPFWAGNLAMKYERVLQAVADGKPPTPCCSGGATARECFARTICPMGKF